MQPTGDGNGSSSNSSSSHPGAGPSVKPEQQQPAAPPQQQQQWQYLPPPSNVVEIDDVQVTPIDDPFYDPTNPSSNFDRSSRDAGSTAAAALRDSHDARTAAAGAQHPSTNAVAIDDVDFEGFAAPLLEQGEAGGEAGFLLSRPTACQLNRSWAAASHMFVCSNADVGCSHTIVRCRRCGWRPASSRSTSSSRTPAATTAAARAGRHPAAASPAAGRSPRG